MANFRKTFFAAIVKSLLRGKSLIQAIIAYWMHPSDSNHDVAPQKSLQDFLKDAEASLLGPVSGDGLVKLSGDLRKQFFDNFQADGESMLPSYSHQLPTGQEHGQYLALDVGGSTLRVALVKLSGRSASGAGSDCDIVSMQVFRITRDIKNLEGMAFFNWMAARIKETLSSSLKQDKVTDKPIPVALAWSFPIEQTSLGGGKFGRMGKGFLADVGLLGQDLGDIIKKASENEGLNVELQVIVNDSSACLLSRAYSHPSTRFGLILGTGVNIAAYMPVSTLGRAKFGVRPAGWFDEASHVIVNTELGMFGTDILPLTRWDELLLKDHARPEFQPLEYLVSGMYLGEIVRIAIVEAVASAGLLGGVLPESLTTNYTLGTDTISMIGSDSTSELTEAIKLFSERHPSTHIPTTADMAAIKALATFVSVRSSALVATCLYTLWDARLEGERDLVKTLPADSPLRKRVEEDIELEKTTVSFNGSVIENFPGYLESCQRYITELLQSKGYAKTRSIELVIAKESSLIGAAVALACINPEA
ncbi:hexokinase-1 [Cordyceps militaris]|nr:hexokinase-1 [Cordyceps militaris]